MALLDSLLEDDVEIALPKEQRLELVLLQGQCQELTRELWEEMDIETRLPLHHPLQQNSKFICTEKKLKK